MDAFTDPRDGLEYVTATEAARRLPVLRNARDRLDDWKRRGLVRVLLDAAGRPVRPVMFAWRDITATERRTRRSARGARRAAA